MKKYIITIIVIGFIHGYIRFLEIEKKNKMEVLSNEFKKLCVKNTKCITQPMGWVRSGTSSYYDKSSKYPIFYQAENNGLEFKLTWKIATGTTLIARDGLGKKLIISKEFD